MITWLAVVLINSTRNAENYTRLRLMKLLPALLMLVIPNWASEASPTLGCSIEISRDIYMYVYIYVVGMSEYVCRMSN